MQSIKISHQMKDQVCIVTPIGLLYNHESLTFSEYLEPLLSDPEIQTLLLDFEQLKMVGSTGVGTLVGTYMSLAKRNAQFGVFMLTYLPTVSYLLLTHLFLA